MNLVSFMELTEDYEPGDILDETLRKSSEEVREEP